ncbi:MAG TPA: hypothetical protein VK646_00060 [Actinomycetota bacterium]|nr:hypothetical protein [Actinomycetota bacterium]
MATRPASDPVTVPAGITILCAIALATGLALLRGAPFALAIPTMAAAVVVSVLILVRRPRPED